VGGLVLRGAEHVRDPWRRRVIDVGDGPVGLGVEDRGADAFGLVQPDDALHRCVVEQCVVEGVDDRPDRGADDLEVEVLLMRPPLQVESALDWQTLARVVRGDELAAGSLTCRIGSSSEVYVVRAAG